MRFFFRLSPFGTERECFYLHQGHLHYDQQENFIVIVHVLLLSLK